MAKSNKNINCIIYARLSQEDGYDSTSVSIENQISICKDYANENGLIITKILYDDGYSGTNFNRPAFIKMIEMLERKEANCVIVKDLSRFGRNFLQVSAYVEDYFPAHRIRLISINDNYDSENPDDEELCVAIRNFLNGYYAKECAKKMKEAIDAKAKKRTISTVGVYGYKIDKSNGDRKLVIDEEAAKVVKLIFDLFNNGFSVLQIQAYLEEHKILTKGHYKQVNRRRNFANLNENPYKWNVCTIYDILKDKHYLGHTVNYKTVNKDLMIMNTHEPIITQEEFDNVQSKFVKTDLTNRCKFDDRLYKTVVNTEGKCFIVAKMKNVVRYRLNKVSIRADVLHDAIYKDILKLIKDVSIDKTKFDNYFYKHKYNPLKDKEISKLKQKRILLDNKIQTLFEKEALGEIDEITYELDMNIYKTQIEEINQKINNYNMEKFKFEKKKEDFFKFIEEFEKVKHQKNKVEIIRMFVEKVVLSKENNQTKIKITYKFQI